MLDGWILPAYHLVWATHAFWACAECQFDCTHNLCAYLTHASGSAKVGIQLVQHVVEPVRSAPTDDGSHSADVTIENADTHSSKPYLNSRSKKLWMVSNR